MTSALRAAILVGILANVFVLTRQFGNASGSADPISERAKFRTKLNGISFFPNGPAHQPPADVYKVIRYPGQTGTLAAYLTPDRNDGKKRPAVIWAHGGYGGIRDYAWTTEDDQSPRAFLNNDFVVMCPSWRHENDNRGSFELFLGEVDDLLAAVDYLHTVSYVDTNRIYIVGYSNGGTLAVLAAESTNTFRAAFAVAAATDIARLVADGTGDGLIPFDPRDECEIAVRNPTHFINSLRVPTFYLDGGTSWEAPDACKLELLARKAKKPFHSVIVPRAHHWSILQPASALIAEKIRHDTGPTCQIEINVHEARAIYDGMLQPQQVFN